MSGELAFAAVYRHYRRYAVLSLVICILLVPISDAVIIQRDRNRNMVYGELFWQIGLGVYGLTDHDLKVTYHAPADHMLTGVLNVTYEYPIITLLFYAVLALIEPGIFGPSHCIANIVLVGLAHVNVLLFLYIGQGNWDKKWFRQLAALYYVFGLGYSIGFAKAEPLADMFLLASIVLLRGGSLLKANALLGVAVQTKIYPVLVFPVFAAAGPLASISFFVSVAALSLPLLMTGMGYTSLLAHLSSSPSYSTIITNPFYVGLGATNPSALLAPASLVIAFLYCVLETRTVHHIPVPVPRLRLRSWLSVYLFALPLVLMCFSWVLIWYYSWFIPFALMLKTPEEMSRYRWMIAALWIAHSAGIIMNLDYFMTGPIAEFFGHLRS